MKEEKNKDEAQGTERRAKIEEEKKRWGDREKELKKRDERQYSRSEGTEY